MKNIPAFDDKIRRMIRSAGYEQALPGMNERIMNRVELTSIIKARPQYKPVISVIGWILFALVFLGLLIISFVLQSGEDNNQFNLVINTEKAMSRLIHFFSFPHISLNFSNIFIIAFIGLLILLSLDVILHSIFEKSKRSK